MKGDASFASRVWHQLQSGVLAGVIRVLRLAGPAFAAAACGWVARSIGPHLSASRVAERNLHRALPDLIAPERAAIIRAVWDNLGRNVGELPHLASFGRTENGPGWEVVGEEHLVALKAAGTPALFFSGHLGNWEMILPIAAALGVEVSGFYRASSNGQVDAAVQGMRRKALGPRSFLFAKGRRGAREALGHLRGGGSLGLLIDQKMNDGIAVPFFGRDAMTAPALAQMALRFDLPILPVHVERVGPGRLRMVCEAPLARPDTGSRQGDIYAISLLANATLERWIRREPASWLWLHRRWPKEVLPIATSRALATIS